MLLFTAVSCFNLYEVEIIYELQRGVMNALSVSAIQHRVLLREKNTAELTKKLIHTDWSCFNTTVNVRLSTNDLR